MDIWPYQWQVLQVLAGADDEWLDRGEVSELAGMKYATARTALEWADEEGLVRKLAIRKSREKVKYRLTNYGKRLWGQIKDWERPAFGSGVREVDETEAQRDPGGEGAY